MSGSLTIVNGNEVAGQSVGGGVVVVVVVVVIVVVVVVRVVVVAMVVLESDVKAEVEVIPWEES